MDKELSDGEFISCLERAEIFKSMAISRSLVGFRDAKGLRHLVRRWSPSLHTFFYSIGELFFLISYSIGELTIILEDVFNNLLLPVFGDENPFDIQLSSEDLKVED